MAGDTMLEKKGATMSSAKDEGAEVGLKRAAEMEAMCTT